MISIVNYISMAAIIYNDPVVNLKAWEEMYEINHGVGLFWSPEDYILIPFPMFHNYVRVIQKIKPDEIKEYNSELKEYSPITEDHLVMNILEENINLIASFVGIHGDYLIFTDNRYPITYYTEIFKIPIVNFSDKTYLFNPFTYTSNSIIKKYYKDLPLDLQADFVRKFLNTYKHFDYGS